jgi:hypothetical protein
MAEPLAIITEQLTKFYGRTPGCQEVCLAVSAGSSSQ